jgi:diguanylate cyclase (GGDEF)-like protein
MERTGAGQRIEKLRISAGCPEGTLKNIRDSLAQKLEDETIDAFREISKISSRISSRSEISTSLETLGILARADRILALRVKGSNVSIIEAYGPGGSKLPGTDVEEEIFKFPREKISIDNFGETPFGSRRYLIIPTEKSVIPSRRERKLHSLHSRRGNYLLIEMDSPFYNISGTVEFFVEGLCRQIGSALLLRDRESMAYIDTLTGSDIGYSWMKQLVTLKDNETSAGTPLSVLLVDVDGLREINSLFGYRVGDNTLKTVVSTIKALLRPGDIIGRFREDLFGVLLPKTGGENTIKIAERICSVIASAEIRPDRVPVTVSIGASISSSRKENPELTVNRAYAALNQCKSYGGNGAILWSLKDDVNEFDSETMMIFNTGDPGWDHSISIAIMELLTRDSTALEMLAEKLRDVLRSEFIYLEDGNGNSFRIGSSILKRIPEKIHDYSTNRIRTHSGIMGKYDALSVGLTDGGKLISAWDNVDGISGSLKNVFRALASLTSLLIQGGSVISEHPPELRP